MPRKMEKATTASNIKTAEQMREQEFARNTLMYENAKSIIKKLIDVNKATTKSLQTFNKQTLQQYLQNVTKYERKLRDLSWYLYYRSMTYRRVIHYYANMFYLNGRNIIPQFDISKKPNKNSVLKSYYETIELVDKMNLQLEFLKVYLNNFIQDVFYGVAYLDETGFFILPLPPEYCKIEGNYTDGSYYYKMDMQYFTGRNKYLIELWGEPFVSMYKLYEQNKQENRWVEVPAEYSVCTKYSIEDFRTIVPPFAGAFANLINLEDVTDIQAVADSQEIYKLLYYKMATLSGSKQSDSFEITPDMAIEYLNRFIEEAVPDYTSFGMVPGGADLGVIDFSSNDKVNDTTKVAKATKEVLNTTGGAQVLNGITITGAEAMRIAQRVDTEFAISSLLPQTQAIVNRLISYKINDASIIKFFPVSAYTRDEFRETLLSSSQNGFSANILAYNSLNGISEKDTIAMTYLIEDALQLSDKLRPLSTSYTQTSNDTDPVTGGRPKEDGEASEKSDKSNG